MPPGTRLKCDEPGCGGSLDDSMTCKRCGKAAPGVALADLVREATDGSGRKNGGVTTGHVSNTSHSTGRTSAAGRTSGFTSSGSTTVVGSTTVRRQKIGFGLVDLPAPDVASLDRFAGLRVAERDPDVIGRKLLRRGIKCGNPKCKHQLHFVKGVCPRCSEPYDYSPLPVGAIIDDNPQHPGTGTRAVAGFLGAGAMGAVYIVWNFMVRPGPDDLTLLQAVIDGGDDGAELHGRTEVVKVILNATNPAQARAQLLEMENLTRVEHPNMARLYGFFVGHTASNQSSNAMAMEYIAGDTLEALREKSGAPLPLAQGIALVLSVADLLTYLHGTVGYTLGDIKGDNTIYSASGAKVVDAGGLHRIGVGGEYQVAPLFQAPELATTGGTPQTDVFALFQMLNQLVLTNFGFDSNPPDNAVVAIGADPIFPDTTLGIVTRKVFMRGLTTEWRKRFYADEAADQLLGLLRQLTADPNNPRPFESHLFTNDISDAAGSDFDAPDPQSLPLLRPNTEDPGYAAIAGVSYGSFPLEERLNALQSAQQTTPDSFELRYAAIATRIAMSATDPPRIGTAWTRLNELREARVTAERKSFTTWISERESQGARIKPAEREFVESYSWKDDWYRGLICLRVQHRVDELDPIPYFTRVSDWLPGEIAPLLGLAMAYEVQGQFADAARWYEHVWGVDPSYRTAAYGFVRSLISQPSADLAAFTRATAVLDQLAKSGDRLAIHNLRARLFLKAAPGAWRGANSDLTLGGVPLTTSALRLAAEREFNRCCTFAKSRPELARYIRLAGQARPLTTW